MREGLASERSDAEIIRSSWSDPDAFGLIFTRHHDQLFRYLAARCGTETASEITADTFAAAFDQRRGFDPSYESARPWLFGIAGNLLKRHFRRHAAAKRQVRPLDTESEEFEEDIAWRADAEHLVRESGLIEAIDSLRWEDREVLFLYAFGDLTYTEIADACGLPVGTVRSRLSRARGKLFGPLERVSRAEPDQ